MSKWEEVEAVSKRIVEEVGNQSHILLISNVSPDTQVGHPTVIVNNAGVVQGKRIVDLSPNDIRQ